MNTDESNTRNHESASHHEQNQGWEPFYLAHPSQLTEIEGIQVCQIREDYSPAQV